jgi:hypothetical protein
MSSTRCHSIPSTTGSRVSLHRRNRITFPSPGKQEKGKNVVTLVTSSCRSSCVSDLEGTFSFWSRRNRHSSLMSSGRKFKALDPQRSNTLPRYVTDESVLASSQREKEKNKLLSSSLDQATRDEIRRLMRSENGANNPAMQRIEEKKRIEMEKRKAHEEAIYSLDMETLETTFHLPGKPGVRTTLPAELSRRTPVKKTVKVSHNEKNAQETAGMNFLPNLLGQSLLSSPLFIALRIGRHSLPESPN